MMYEILFDNMPRLMNKLTMIENKCRKYGCEFHFEELGEIFREVTDEDTQTTHKAKFVQVEVSGIAKVLDWEFIATIEHGTPVNIIRSFRPDVEIPERYYTADTRCEHCGTKRNRKDTYLIRNVNTGEFKQVGRSCLKDFTHGLSAEAVASYISWFDNLIKGEAPCGGFTPYYDVAEVIQYSVECVRLYGYSKSYSEGESTVSIVREQMFGYGDADKRIERDGYDVDHAGNKEKAAAILSWVSSLDNEFGYVSNLKAACSKECCERRDFGLICSAVAAYNREMDKQKRIEASRVRDQKSQWVGTEGERIDLKDLTCKLLTSWETEFGYTYMYKFTDLSGNVYTWKTGKWLGGDEDCNNIQVSLRGTVKAHNEYNGILQTELTRCKVL